MILSGRIEEFARYSNFSTLKDFNNTIEMFLADHKKDFSKGEYIAFKYLTKWCAKVVGVANGKIQTFLEHMHKKFNLFAVSRSTFNRMLAKAKKLGILTVLTTKRSKGGQNHNLFVFNKYIIDVAKKEKLTKRKNASTPSPTKVEEPKTNGDTTNLLDTNITLSKKRMQSVVLDHTYTNESVPTPFIMSVSPFFDDSKTIQEYWSMVKILSYDMRHVFDDDYCLPIAIISFKQMISKWRSGKVKNPIAYFAGIYKKKINFHFMDYVEEISGMLPY